MESCLYKYHGVFPQMAVHSKSKNKKAEVKKRKILVFGNENGSARGGQKGAMDRTGGHTACEICATVRRSTLGFYCKSFRFEGGGRQDRGLNRTGKSCRLRWVNYLHPGLKRGKMTTQEERLVLELHAKWGNRWSRIARKLPGRTDNEIKNYWRTHMRKKAQERKRATISSSSSSSTNSLSPSSTVTKASFYDTGGVETMGAAIDLSGGKKISEEFEEFNTDCYSMDDIWKDIELSEEKNIKQDGNGNFACPSMASPDWDYCWDFIWKMDDEDEESKMMINLPNDDQFISSCAATLTG